MRPQIYCILLVAMSCLSCEKDEIPVEPFDRGDVESVQIAMGSDYETQVWYDLSDGKVVSTNDRFAWDIAFDCNDSAHFIYLNTSVVMMAAKAEGGAFEDEIDVASLSFRLDHPSGIKDSLALGHWWQQSAVWVIDLGYCINGSKRGYRQMQFSLTSDNKLTITHAKLDGSDLQSATIAKDDRMNRIAFSFSSNQAVSIDPPKTDYDIVFTTYTHLFYNPFTPYSVSGVLLNPHQTTAVQIDHLSFEEIDETVARETVLTDSADVIGYDWKYYDLDAAQYTVFSNQNYIVRDNEGFYYKLHFVDFYNDAGEKGFPTMEVQRL
ncbi:MAG: HmuY family protein [Salibacteraceae bacterium]